MAHSSGIPAKVAVVTVLLMALASQAQVPSAPALSSPPNGAGGQPTTLTLTWNAVSGASSYTLQVSQTSAFSTMLINQGGILAISQVISGLVVNNSYFWRVNATGTSGTSTWSSIWSFTTAAPDAPALSSPANGAMNQPTTITINWSASSGATTYGLQVSIVSTFATSISNQINLLVTSVSMASLSYNTTFFWRANATNSSGTSVWSGNWSFTTVQKTAIPALISPANGATNQPTSLTLNWNPVSSASSYALQVSTVSDFSINLINQTGITATSMAVAGLSNSTNYFWRAEATGPNGTSAWSGAYSFATTILVPSVPLLTSPPNNATDVSYQPVFTWQVANNTTTYTLQLSSASDFSSTIMSQSGLNSRDSGMTLTFNSMYFWRVNGTNSLGTGAWSSILSFTVSAPIPNTRPVVISPLDSVITPMQLFSWGLVVDATSYEFTITRFIAGIPSQNPTIFDAILSTTSWSDSALLASYIKQNYYGLSWLVRPFNGSGRDFYSNGGDFILKSSSSTLHPNAHLSSPSFSLRNSFLSYTLPSALPVELSLYSLLGRRIVILNSSQSPGLHVLSLKGRNLPAGVYFLHFKAGIVERRMKIILPDAAYD